ncbi:predicted protein [Nematostella vectensis]|uniref:Migration and invasion-inhibitory protein n=1 Tax=Nematostella vectensis TaxID=45351 RepID=A7T838_NEMVE|nr:predicted protein [Nematostella vectensis]|eukprot:XP_001619958.1 hypothetical protein NEMVEDRAFT_v1g248810 [Nematostella vectensis]
MATCKGGFSARHHAPGIASKQPAPKTETTTLAKSIGNNIRGTVSAPVTAREDRKSKKMAGKSWQPLSLNALLDYKPPVRLLGSGEFRAEKHDDFFDDLKEFRRVNKQDCFSQALPDSLLTPYRTTPRKINEEFEEEKEEYTCANTYRLNERLFAERVHEPDVACSVCKSQPEPEYESEGSYVSYYIEFPLIGFRVSVPRSTLQSPYKIKPHRRVSFDPTDTIGLSSHCLAGWESSKPAVVPPQSSLDLKASLHHSRATLDASRIGRFSPPSQHSTQELLEHSALMRYGLQVLDKERGPSTRPHTTPYPAY